MNSFILLIGSTILLVLGICYQNVTVLTGAFILTTLQLATVLNGK